LGLYRCDQHFAFDISFFSENGKIFILVLEQSKSNLRYTDRDSNFANASDLIEADANVLVTISDATFSYEKKKRILVDVNLVIKKSDFVVVIGDVGSGKSSLALAILGLLVRDTGVVATCGSIAYAPQQVGFDSNHLFIFIVLGLAIRFYSARQHFIW
jgi:ABC-type multidrug transport system fused ATPase/permease subunit